MPAGLNVKVSTLTPEEHEARRKGISASDIPALLELPGPGGGKGRTPRDVYNEKVGLQRIEEDSSYSEWGSLLEEVVARAYAKKHGLQVLKSRTFWNHAQLPALSHPDFEVVGSPELLLEIKTTDKDLGWEWGPDGSSKVPARVEAQVRWQMYTTGAERVDVAVLIGGNDYREYTITHDPAWEGLVVPLARDFWFNHVVAKAPPSGPTKLTWEVATVEPQTEEAAEDNSPDLAKLVVALHKAEAIVEEAQDIKTDLRAKLIERIGRRKGLVGDWGSAKLSTVSGREKVDWKKVAEEVKGLVEPSTFMQIVDSHTSKGSSYKMLRYKLTEG